MERLALAGVPLKKGTYNADNPPDYRKLKASLLSASSNSRVDRTSTRVEEGTSAATSAEVGLRALAVSSPSLKLPRNRLHSPNQRKLGAEGNG